MRGAGERGRRCEVPAISPTPMIARKPIAVVIERVSAPVNGVRPGPLVLPTATTATVTPSLASTDRPSASAPVAVPTFVAHPYVIRDGSVTPGQHASFLGKAHDPLLVTSDPNAADFKLPELSLPLSGKKPGIAVVKAVLMSPPRSALMLMRLAE